MHTTSQLTDEQLAAELAAITGDAIAAVDDQHCRNCGATLREFNFTRYCGYCAYQLNAEAEYDRRRELEG